MKLYSYVVDHDTGYAPNPFYGLCTLACCKFSKTGLRRNIVELAKNGDWVVGTGGVGKRSSGHGKIIYAMQVTETIPFADYCNSPKFRKREDAGKNSPNETWRRALISKNFFYFGCNAVKIPKRFSEIVCGRGFKRHFTETFMQKFVTWIKTHKRGKSGQPCALENKKSSAKSNKKPRGKC
jgi:Nucleotide modification associated domain 2